MNFIALILAGIFSVTPVSAQTLDASCPVMSGFMKMGAPNDPAEVSKLQVFLRTREDLDVDPTGIFDAKTGAGVEAFQRKYMADVMGPWGATRATGVVYITTAKKINQLVCGAPLTLNPDETSMVADYRKAAAAAEAQNAATASDSDNVAAAADSAHDLSPVSNGFWNFVKSFFQR